MIQLLDQIQVNIVILFLLLNKSMKSKNIILLFCIIEILLVIPRTISYILIDIIPVRIFSLPLVTFSFLVTITGYLFTEIFANRKILKSLQNLD